MKLKKEVLCILLAACGGASNAPAETAATAEKVVRERVEAVGTSAEETARAAAPEVGTAVLTNEQGQAVSGYDVVSYHQGAPTAGSTEFSVEHNGATYLFANAENRDAFSADPARYVPAFGGWCAFAVAESGAKAPIDPATYRIQDGRLLLFFNGEFNGQDVDTSVLWDQSPEERLRQADERWPAVAVQ